MNTAQQTIDYTLVRSKRRTIGIEIRPDGQVLVRAPKRAAVRLIESFIARKQQWIQTHVARIQDRDTINIDHLFTPMSRDEIRRKITDRVDIYATTYHFTYTKVRISNAKTRWGSCSSSGTIAINWRLAFCPTHVMDYVIVHELAHTEQMNHGPKFWAIVARICPDYKRAKAWLKDHQRALSEWAL
ncbi:MAG: SprT family zinc-dependent metalloprotease [bacterium]|nr:SprT family zinc-dependent metalloprotease [bacterium]